MSEGLKQGWTKVAFGEIAEHIAERVEPTTNDSDKYIGLEHLDSGSLTIRRWGTDITLAGTKLRMRKGDILFAKRNAYLKRVAIAPHDGLFSAHGMVLRAKPEIVLPEFLPFFMQSDLFMERAKQISVGSLSPTINWKTLAKEEFALPPMEEQRRLAHIASKILEAEESQLKLISHLHKVRESYSYNIWSDNISSADHQDLNTVCLKIQDGTHFSPKTNNKGPYRYVTSKNIRNGYIDTSNIEWIDKHEHDKIFKRCDVKKGDLLFTKDGVNAGNVAINIFREPISLLSSVAFIRPDPNYLLPQYLFSYLHSQVGRSKVLMHIRGSAITRLTLDQIKSLQIPVPEITEQEKTCRYFWTLKKTLDMSTKRMLKLAEIKQMIVINLEG